MIAKFDWAVNQGLYVAVGRAFPAVELLIYCPYQFVTLTVQISYTCLSSCPILKCPPICAMRDCLLLVEADGREKNKSTFCLKAFFNFEGGFQECLM